MKMTEFFMRRPVLFWSLMAAIVIAGVLAFVQMPKLEDPAVSGKQAMVVVAWPGASAHDVELDVAQLMEDELRALPNVKKVKTECRNGSAMFTVEFQMTVLEKELEQYFDLLRRKVNDVASRLPQGCYAPVVDRRYVGCLRYFLCPYGRQLRLIPKCTAMPNTSAANCIDVKGRQSASTSSGGRDEVNQHRTLQRTDRPQRHRSHTDHIGLAGGRQESRCGEIRQRRRADRALRRFGRRKRGGHPQPDDSDAGRKVDAYRRHRPRGAHFRRAAAERIFRRRETRIGHLRGDGDIGHRSRRG